MTKAEIGSTRRRVEARYLSQVCTPPLLPPIYLMPLLPPRQVLSHCNR